MDLYFYKYHGAGNDFILIDDRALTFQASRHTLIRDLCTRNFGIGADGLILLRNNPDSSNLQMLYFNADGYPGSMCGNGGRCFAMFARDLGISSETIAFEAFDGQHTGRYLQDGRISLSMQDCPFPERRGADFFIDTGSPHFVRFVDDLPAFDPYIEGKKIRDAKPYAEHGVNVNFVTEINGNLEMRTYERGVENLTLSCGTGVTAAVLCYAFSEDINSGAILTKSPGGEIVLQFRRQDSGYTDLYLIGPATRVFEGVIKI